MPAPPSTRAYAAAHFALELDGKDDVGLFRSIEGGSIRADVMTYQSGSNYDRWRQLGKPKFEDIKLQVGMAMSAPFYLWIEKFFTGVAERKTGAIVAADFYYNERARRQFDGAMIKELTFPKLDGSDKNAAYMTVGISVEDMKFSAGTGKKLSPPSGFDTQKLWTACNFSFELKGFESACRRVTKIDSFTVKQNVLEYHRGGALAPTKVPSQIDFPNITFYVPEADAAPFQDHLQKNSILPASAPARLGGAIHILDNAGRELFSLSYAGADILAVTPDRSDSSSEEIKMVKVEIFTETMTFKYATASSLA